MKFKKMISLLLVVILAMSSFTGCSNNDAKNPDNGGKGEPEILEDGMTGKTSDGVAWTVYNGKKYKNDLVFSEVLPCTTINTVEQVDPPMTSVMRLFYDGLVKYDAKTKEYEPRLATSWDVESDTEVVFHLRKGVKFHDGNEMKASDVKFSFERARDSLATKTIWFWLDHVEVIDEYTVKVVMKEPYVPMFAVLNMTSASIVSEDFYKNKATGKAFEECGAGPYVLADYGDNDFVKGTRFEDYWDIENIFTQSITFKAIGDGSSAIVALQTNQVDALFEVEKSYVPSIKDDPNIEMIIDEEDTGIYYVGFNNQKAPFNDKKVRQAMSLALDKEAIAASVLYGIGRETASPLLSGLVGYDPSVEPIGFNMDKAKALMQETPYKDGFECTTILYAAGIHQTLAEYCQSQWKELGITLNINVMEYGAWLDKTAKGEYDLFNSGFVAGSNFDAEGILRALKSINIGYGGNRAFYSNPVVDDLINKANAEYDSAKRNELLSEVQKVLVDESPWCLLPTILNLTAVGKGVENITWSYGGEITPAYFARVIE